MKKGKMFKIAGIAVVGIMAVVLIVGYIFDLGAYDEMDNPYAFDDCNVAGVILHGDVYTYYDSESQSLDDVASGEELMYFLGLAEDTEHIQAILLEIDSYGGFPVAAQEIADMLKNHVTKPVIAQIRGAGLSAAYWVASGADYIFASELSDVGSIGVTQSYVDGSKFNEKEGFVYNSLRTGKFKDILNPEKPLTQEERALLQRDLDITHEVFVANVAHNRGMTIEQVQSLADGSSMLGQMALDNGLIDEIGKFYEAKDYIEQKLGISDPVVCW